MRVTNRWLAVALVLLSAGCATSSSPIGAATRKTAAARQPAPVATVSGSVSVFAAASLASSFTELAVEFQRTNPQAVVTLNFAGSSTLVAQIRNGAPADVFASADSANMDRLVSTGLVDGRPSVFTRNTLMIVVPKGNPLRVRSLADLARPDVVVALGAVGVPAGDYARQVLQRARVTVKPKSLESNVKAIVTKAALKEIDAGIVYVTDVDLDNSRVDGVAISLDQNIIADYPVAALKAAKNPAAAKAFATFTRSASAQAIMAKFKFLPPT